jgi:hypothetical protein
MLVYGKHVALTAGNAGNAQWSKDKSIFSLHDRPIYISRFRKIAQDINLPSLPGTTEPTKSSCGTRDMPVSAVRCHDKHMWI